MERDVGKWREELLAGLSCRVIEIGAGNGINFAHYPPTVIELVAMRSVPDPAAALAELRRVLRPGGELRFMEHVRGEHPRKAAAQKWLDRSGIWSFLGGGCHCARDSVAAIRAAGFEIVGVHDFSVGPSWALSNPHVLGRARTTSTS